MAKLILGITGEMGSGKGTIAKHIMQQHKGSVHKFSTILRDVLDRLYLEQSRDNLQALSTMLRKTYGEDIMAKGMYHDAENNENDLVVVDGVRRMSDITYLKELPHFKLVYVEADMENRYERIAKRGENPDDAKKTFEEFQKAHENESEIQIRDLKNYASYIVNNDGTYQELYAQVDKIIKENLA
ncbi:MAG: AAA family ATPase [Candidatus Moranbacteria bacterium]|nr:AAA family ATPase [Candidatus Moranbacteria bacterium]